MAPVYLVLAACIGYVFCQCCHLQRYRIARKSGWYSYLHVTSFGLAFVAAGIVLGTTVIGFLCAIEPVCGIDFSADGSRLISDGLSAAVAATVSCVVINATVDRAEALSRAWKDDLSRLLQLAISRDDVITLYLESGKIIEGYVLDTFEPSEENSHVTVLPTMIGHQNPDTFELEIEELVNEPWLRNVYEETTETAEDSSDVIEPVEVTIPRASIVLCRRG